MSLKTVSDYKHNNTLRNSFNNLAKIVFGIDFEEWYRKDLWEDNYICHSFTENDNIVSNVSVSRMNLLIKNNIYSSLQIGTVMTHPEFRRKNLARSLMEMVLKDNIGKFDIIFLFPEDNAIQFYNNFGFKTVSDHYYLLDHNPQYRIKNRIKKISIDNIQLLKRLYTQRILSDNFDTLDSFMIFTWYCCDIFKDNIYYIEEKDTLMIYEKEDDTLILYQLLSPVKQELKGILQYIPEDGIKRIKILYNPCFSDIENDQFIIEKKDIIMYKSDNIELPSVFNYPILAQA